MWLLPIVLVEIRKTHVRQTGSGINISIAPVKIALMSNISKIVTVRNHPWAIDCHRELWPWMTLNCPSSTSSESHVKYLKIVTDAMLWWIEVEYEIIHGPSIDNMTFDLGWSWTVLYLGHRTITTNTSISNAMRDTMLYSKEVIWETINGLSIGPMYFDTGWPWTGQL